jgi:iron complex transport system substrate-binding protein
MKRRWAAVLVSISACIVATFAPLVPLPASASPPAPAERILSLSASATQMLYAIGAGKQVVGVDKYSTWPPNAPRTKLTGYESNAEAYLYLHPDLVVFAFSEGSLIRQLADLHIRTLLLPPAATMAQVDAQLAELGQATGHAARARAAERSLAAHVAAAVRSARGRGKGDTYYIELGPGYYTATSKTFMGVELSLFGLEDIADPAAKGTMWPQVSAEYILKENPDYVFLADTVCCHQTASSFAKRPGFSFLRAVKLHHVVPVNDSFAQEWGPHSIEAFVGLIARVLAK